MREHEADSAPTRIATRSRPIHRYILAALFGTFLAVAPSPDTIAQSHGRWWWDAEVGLGQRNRDRVVDGARVSDWTKTDLLLGAGLNGFVVHPAIANFRVDLDMVFSRGRNVLDSNKIGGGFVFNLLPKNSYPLEIFASRRNFAYPGSSDLPQSSILGLPDAGTLWGARFAAKNGPMRGTRVGIEGSSFDYPQGTESLNRQYFEWSRGYGVASHNVIAEHIEQSFALTPMRYQSTRVAMNESLVFPNTWRWQMTTSGLSRETEVLGGDPRFLQQFQTRNRVIRQIGARDQIDFNLQVLLSRDKDFSPVDRYSATLGYRWFPGPEWQLAPFVRYELETTPDLGVSFASPNAGLLAVWTRSRDTLAATVTSSLSWGTVDITLEDEERSERTIAGYAVGTLRLGRRLGLQKLFEVEIRRNELRVDRESDVLPPELLFPFIGTGIADTTRVRFGLNHAWDSQSVSGWLEWRQASSRGDIRVGAFESDDFRGTLSYQARKWSVSGNFGTTDVQRESGADGFIRYAALGAHWQPTRFVRVRGAYRVDERDLQELGANQGRIAEIATDIRIGRMVVTAGVFQWNTDLDFGRDTRRREFRVAIRRNFSGWLPIVTGTQRRGVIR